SKRSREGVAKQRERCSCLSVRMFTANTPLSRIIGSVELVRSTHTSTSGGLSETEQNALTVKPASVSWLFVVTTVTPVAKRPITCRKKSFSIAIEPFVLQTSFTEDMLVCLSVLL